MKKYIVLTALPLLLSGIASAHTVADSVGVEKKDGKRFILHRVDQGQTLYAIARRYSSSVSAIKAANPTVGDAVRYAQVVRVPVAAGALSRKEARAIRKEEKAKDKEAKKSADSKDARRSSDPAKAGIHVVEPGQTLYSLAVRYGVAQSDLRKWNNLPGNNVLIGQALIVTEKAYQARTPSTPIATAPEKNPTPNRPETPARTAPKPERPAQKKTEEPIVAKTDNPAPKTDNASSTRPNNSSAISPKPDEEIEVETPRPGNDAPMPTLGRRIATSGVAEMIEGDGSGKYLALHRTAPIGTLVQVRNEFNNQSLWVKVIGRLPNTGVNDKILIKLSTQAFAKLSPQDRRFRAEVSYIAP